MMGCHGHIVTVDDLPHALLLSSGAFVIVIGDKAANAGKSKPGEESQYGLAVLMA